MQLNPDFPAVTGCYQMTKEWSVILPSKFNRRFEDGSLVIWKPGFTMWIIVWNNDKSESPQGRLAWIKAASSPAAFDHITETSDCLLRHAYRLDEESEDERQPAFYCYVIGAKGHVQMSFYFDRPEDLDCAQEIWRSVSNNDTGATSANT